MVEKKKSSRTQTQFTKLMKQAKDSVTVLRSFEKQAVSKAKAWVKLPNLPQMRSLPSVPHLSDLANFPNLREQKRLTNEKILTGLTKMGLATQAQVDELESKIKKLESSLSQKAARTTRTPKQAAKD